MDSSKPLQAQSPQFYTELNQLNDLRRKANGDKEAALKEVAQQFEQIFLSMMLKSMRDANESFAQDNPFNGNNTRFYQDMYDQQMTLDLSQNSRLGLAEIMVRQLSQVGDLRNQKDDDDESRTQMKTDTERMLNTAVDATARLAASAVLGKAHTQASSGAASSESAKSVKDVDSATASKASKTNGSVENLPERFNSPDEFVSALLPLAENVAQELGVDPKVLLAQAALETGWGRFVIEGSHNLFNIKADRRWDGDRVSVSTLEYRQGQAQREMASFRSYANYEESFRDYVDFLKTNPRYQQALQNTSNPSAYLRELQAAGYATDPAYAKKIEQIYTGSVMARVNIDTQEG
ncbi:flagellar assembly peptidoglycan hydrolase FlgJ [Nitrincola alkalisediminis]|uniref:flagellar assembly peptidoglycan hydrolase FlgJ n=1 Tax=Nitrincola alkalisediminis TaxID=1366656 RepID=UPI001875F5A2|nr:flagellar assembly peptidoglycan hydrolase FlgJ [Nitrincola alkalisediminis]